MRGGRSLHDKVDIFFKIVDNKNCDALWKNNGEVSCSSSGQYYVSFYSVSL
jgi:hypothetical protein